MIPLRAEGRPGEVLGAVRICTTKYPLTYSRRWDEYPTGNASSLRLGLPPGVEGLRLGRAPPTSRVAPLDVAAFRLWRPRVAAFMFLLSALSVQEEPAPSANHIQGKNHVARCRLYDTNIYCMLCFICIPATARYSAR